MEEELGRPIFSSAAEALLSIEGYVAPAEGGGYEASISLSDHRGNTYGTRKLGTEAGCRDLDVALTLVISIMLAPEQAQRFGIELPAELASSLDELFADEPSVMDPDSLPSTPPSPGARDRLSGQGAGQGVRGTGSRAAEEEVSADPWNLWIGAGGWVGGGRRPALDVGPFASVRLRYRPLGSLRLRMRLGLPGQQSYPDSSDGRPPGVAYFQTLSSDLAACRGLVRVASTRLGACLVADVGLVSVETEGFRHNGTDRQLWLASGLDMEVWQSFGEHFALVGAAGPYVLLRRPAFQYRRNDGESEGVHRAPSIGWRLDLGLAIRFF
ncbi:MAG: hypothetical protein OXU20_34530 [Myxococcales bacterium]|nr:hypothetical protein [Myxococcales bacterium]MDD9968573.1 hypothetical protein [Myxococcales bacterium]